MLGRGFDYVEREVETGADGGQGEGQFRERQSFEFRLKQRQAL